jgi:uncharacterized membrane protein YebE (DUF533 family)
MKLTTNEVRAAVLGLLQKQGVSAEEAEARLMSLRKEGGIPIVGDLVGGAAKLFGNYAVPAMAVGTVGGGMLAGGLGYHAYKSIQESQDKVRAKELEKQQYLQAIKNIQDAVEHPVGA